MKHTSETLAKIPDKHLKSLRLTRYARSQAREAARASGDRLRLPAPDTEAR